MITAVVMNRYEEQAKTQRNASLRRSTSLWTAGLALVVVMLVIIGLNGGASSSFFKTAAIVVAVVFLVLRQLSRRLGGKGHTAPRAAQPDPKSTLKLD